MSNLLSIDTNAKTIKGQKKGFMTGILYLAPSNESGAMNTCPQASAGCRAACLYTAGRGRFNNVKDARIRKTKEFVYNREGFMLQLANDIRSLVKKAERAGMIPCVRLNGTSDIAWEDVKVEGARNIFELFNSIQFYDYTKRVERLVSFRVSPIKNYHITFSRSESNELKTNLAMSLGHNIAVVFKDIPERWQGWEVVSGDESDLRFLDKDNVIVGLKAKGDAKKDKIGFVV